MDDVSEMLRTWRKANAMKQTALADLLGVSQAAISRWESGLDQPSAQVLARIRSLIGHAAVSRVNTERVIVSQMPGLRALVDLDGVRLLATTSTFKSIWPELSAVEGSTLMDRLVGQSRELYHNGELVGSIRRNEIALISGVSDRQLEGYGDNAFRHYWAATYRKAGTRILCEVSFEACEPDAEVGLRQVLRVDEVSF